jgi:hypothetical protein
MIVTRRERQVSDPRLLALLAGSVSLSSFLFYFRHGWTLLYGDAVAHINIARRVFDSLTPGPLQLGTVWLPLPHLLMMPFLVSDSAWQTGFGGSVPSLVAFVLATMGIYRLVLGLLKTENAPDISARMLAWFAAAIFAANPSLIYLQTTAMTEPVYLAFFTWAVVYFQEFVFALNEYRVLRQEPKSRKKAEAPAFPALTRCGLCLAGAAFTRYDGWFAAFVFVATALFLFMRQQSSNGAKDFAASINAVRKFVFIAAAVPVFWLAYNGIIYRNPLEFANGPYSAKAIERRNSVPGFPPRPGAGNPITAAQYFIKSAELNLAEGILQKGWIVFALLGVLVCLRKPRLRFVLLLWLPLPFYALSVAYSGVPIFVPAWWPFSFYNVRYGIELLPAFAVSIAVAAQFLFNYSKSRSEQAAVFGFMLLFVGFSYASSWRAQPISFREGWANSRSRIALESELAASLRKLPQDSTLLMYLGDHVGALQRAGIPLRRVVNEGNHRTWKRPIDPNGLWEQSLADPGKFAEFAVGFDEDPVSISAREHDLRSLAIIETAGQPPATIYATRLKGNLPR